MAAFTCSFRLNKKEIQGCVASGVRVWLFRYHAGCQWRATGGHVFPFNGIDAFGSQVWMAFCSVVSCCRSRSNRGRFSFLGRWFMEFERFYITESDRLPLATKQQNQPTVRPPGFTPKTYCKEWNRTGTCSNKSNHGQVGTELVRAYC